MVPVVEWALAAPVTVLASVALIVVWVNVFQAVCVF